MVLGPEPRTTLLATVLETMRLLMTFAALRLIVPRPRTVKLVSVKGPLNAMERLTLELVKVRLPFVNAPLKVEEFPMETMRVPADKSTLPLK